MKEEKIIEQIMRIDMLIEQLDGIWDRYKKTDDCSLYIPRLYQRTYNLDYCYLHNYHDAGDKYITNDNLKRAVALLEVREVYHVYSAPYEMYNFYLEYFKEDNYDVIRQCTKEEINRARDCVKTRLLQLGKFMGKDVSYGGRKGRVVDINYFEHVTVKFYDDNQYLRLNITTPILKVIE